MSDEKRKAYLLPERLLRKWSCAQEAVSEDPGIPLYTVRSSRFNPLIFQLPSHMESQTQVFQPSQSHIRHPPNRSLKTGLWAPRATRKWGRVQGSKGNGSGTGEEDWERLLWTKALDSGPSSGTYGLS